MIPPSSLARLVLGYLEEEGLQRTAETFQEECSDVKKDPLSQYSSLKIILEEYTEIKETAKDPDSDPAKVITSLWKKLDVVVGQLKYHTIPESKVPRVKQRTNRRCAFNLQTARPVSSHPNTTTNRKHNKNPSQNKQDFLSISNRSHHVFSSETATDSPRVSSTSATASIDLTLSPSSRNNPGHIMSSTSLEQQQPLKNTDNSGCNVSSGQPLQSYSGHQQISRQHNTSISTFSNDFRQDCSLTTTVQTSSSGSLRCTCSDNSNSTEVPLIDVVGNRTTSPLKSNNDTVMQECNRHYGTVGNKIEILSKSPKRKGHPPKKIKSSNPSPSKIVPVDGDPSMPADNSFDLQQLLDGGNLDIDAAMPLLLDTFLSTPSLQEKLAENINKVVGSTKQNEAATEVLSDSNQVPSSKSDDAAASNHHDDPQVPVDDILNLMEADPAFDALFDLLSTDAVKTASPAKSSQAVATCSYSEPVSSGCTTVTACSSVEPVSTWSTTSTSHSSSPNNNISAISTVTESLLLLASSPSKCLTSTTTTSSLDNLHPISPKEVTPEFVHKQHKENPLIGSCVNGELDSGLGGPGYVRSLQFLDQRPTAPIGKPKKSKPVRQKRNASKTTSNKAGRQRMKMLNNQNKNSQVDELLQGTSAGKIPGVAAREPVTLSTIDLSAVKLLQSFASLHSNGNGNGMGMGTGVKKSQGSNMVQLLQDAAIHQQVQGVSTVNQKQTAGASQSSSQEELIPRSLQTLAPSIALSSSSSNVSQGIDQVKGVNMSQQSVPLRLIAPAPSLNHQGGRILLPRPSIQSQIYSVPISTTLLSSQSSFTSAVSSSAGSSSVTFTPGMPRSSSSLVSSSPLYQLLSMPPSIPSCVQPPQSLSSHVIQSSSSSYVPQSSSSYVPQSSSSYVPQSSSYMPQLSSYISQSSSYMPQSSSLYVPQSSSSYIAQSSSYMPQSSTYVPQSSSSYIPQSASSYVPQSSSYIPQSSSSYIPQSASSYVPQSSSYIPQSSSSYIPQSSSYIPQSSSSYISQSSSSYILQPSNVPQSLSSYVPQSSSSCLQPPPQSSSYVAPAPQSSSSLTMSVKQSVCFPSTPQHSYLDSSHTTTIQKTLDHNPFTNLQTIESENKKTQINSQGINKLENSPISVDMATTEFQGTYVTTRLGSNESSPTSQKAEECVFGFISGFEGGLSCGQSNDQDGLTTPAEKTLVSASLVKDIDSMGLSKNGTNGKEIAYHNEGKKKNGPSRIACENAKKQENKESREVMHIDECCAEERLHGQKRPAGQDLMENKPKKSKQCKKPKKSKLLPKNFDVEKFLSKLHYIEK